MKTFAILFLVVIIVASTIAIPLVSDQFVDANSRRKIHFTQTITSSHNPAMDGSQGQIAMILSPNPGTIYDGSMTYAASKEVHLVILHEITKGDSKGQPTWTVDGETIYAISELEPAAMANTVEFTGAALGLKSSDRESFTATASVDGWIRGQPTEVVMQKLEEKKEEKRIDLARANMLVDLPLHKGFFEGKDVYFVITDSSDIDYAELVTEKQGYNVQYSSILQNATEDSLNKIFVFTNGVQGDGIRGFQSEVFSVTPQSDVYNSLNRVVEVSWKRGQNPEILESEKEILENEDKGRVELKQNVILNAPQIIWPNGKMKTIDKEKIIDEMSFGGQITQVDLENMKVTFTAHRGWGQDGQTIYYLMTSAIPSKTAKTMGIPTSGALMDLIKDPAVIESYQFKNGIKGPGPLGYQPSIFNINNTNYSPVSKIYTVEWKNQSKAVVLQNIDDINYFKENELISVELARPLNADHIINSPVVKPSQ